MKKALFLLTTGFFAYWGHMHRAEIRAEWERFKASTQAMTASLEKKFSIKEIPTDNPEDPPSVVDPEPPAVATKEAAFIEPHAPQPLPELPEGVYYTRERVTMMSDGGIKAISVATKVNKVGEEKDLFIIDDGHTKLAVGPWKLTRDPVEVAKLLQRFSTK